MTATPLHRLAVVAAITVALGSPPSDLNAGADAAPASVRNADTSAAPMAVTAEPPRPDIIADFTGGIAARLHSSGDARVPGHLFVLMAIAGSGESAQLFDEAPFTHDYGTAVDTLESNLAAAATIEMITGIDVDHLELTTPPGGGSSTGVIYAIAYLNVISDGAFTGDLRVAATGRLGSDGYVNPISAIDEKTAAAHLADADVLFSASTSTDVHIGSFGARHVGELFRARNTGATLREERRLDNYRRWGADRPDGMDIVGVRHIADVAAYLCGVGSAFACRILGLIDDTVIGGSVDSEHARAAGKSMAANVC